MQIKTFHIRLSRENLNADEEKLNGFLQDKEIINTFAELVKTEKNYWSILVVYSDTGNMKRANEKSEKLSFPTDTKLTEEQLNIYNSLNGEQIKQKQKISHLS